jgi:hypothetical protein
MKISKIGEQLKIEKEMIGMGAKRYRDGVTQSVTSGQESNTSYGLRIIGQTVRPLAIAIEEFVERTKARPGATHKAVQFIEQCDDYEVIAFLTARSVINCISLKKAFTPSALNLSGSIEEQCKFKQFESDNPALWGTLVKDLKRTPSTSHKKKVLTHSMNKAGIEWMGWEKKWTSNSLL